MKSILLTTTAIIFVFENMKHSSLTASWTAATSAARIFFVSKEGKMQKGVQNHDNLLFCCTQNENAMCRQG